MINYIIPGLYEHFNLNKAFIEYLKNNPKEMQKWDAQKVQNKVVNVNPNKSIMESKIIGQIKSKKMDP